MTTSSSRSPDVAVLIGRFMPFHRGHQALLQQALAAAPRCVVVIGSAGLARTPRNPFTWQEREQMIRLSLTPQEQARVHCVPLRDMQAEGRWVGAVRRAVEAQLPAAAPPRVALVGAVRDPTQAYLQAFEDWQGLPPPDDAPQDIRAAALRATLYEAAGQGPNQAAAALDALAPQLPDGSLQWLRQWIRLPYLTPLAQEWRMLKAYRDAWACAPYPPVFVTVDTVITCAGRVLLIRRGQPPGQGLLAVPGGFIEQRETTWQSALRELEEETGLHLPAAVLREGFKGQAVFDQPDRSQRGRVITHAFHFDLGRRELPAVQAADDAQSAEWVEIDRLPALEDQFHDDHFQILDHFLR